MADKAYWKLAVLILVLVFGFSAAAWAYDDGDIVWSYQTGGALPNINSSPAIGPTGAILVGADDGKLYALNPDGTLLWSYTPALPFQVFSSPTVGNDGTIYFGSFNNLIALWPDGTLKWTFPTGDIISSSPSIATDGIIYVGSGDGKLYAITPDGSAAWVSPFVTGGAISSSPAIAEDGTIYVGSADNKLYAIHPDGTLYWQYLTGGDVDSSPAIAADGTIYVGSNDAKLYAFAPTGGAPLWTFTAGGAIGSSPVIDSSGRICFGANDGQLYVVDPTTHLTVAPFPYGTGGDAISGSPAIAADGTIYVGTFGAGASYLFAFTAAGSLKWTVPIGVANSSPIIGMDGRVYVGSTDGKLYSIYATGGAPQFCWPLFKRDAFHTGDVVPLIGQTIPELTELDVAVNAPITAFFSVPMNPATFTIDSYLVHDGIRYISGTVNYDINTRAAVFTPDANLTYGAEYTVTITADATDTHGIPIASDYVWTFTAIPRYTITAQAGANGSISPAGNTLVVKGNGQHYTITPNANHHVQDVEVDGCSMGAVTDYEFTDVTENHVIVATFAIDTFAISPFYSEGGVITPGGDQTVAYGGDIDFTIQADPNYHLSELTVNDSPVGLTDLYQFTNVTQNYTLNAIFEIDTYTITPDVGDNGSISPDGPLIVEYGSTPTFTLTPDLGYHLTQLLVDGTPVPLTNVYTFDPVTAAHTIHAEFGNQAPVANAGPDQIVYEGQTVFLNARGSTDADGDAKTYFWSQLLPGANAVVLSSSVSSSPTFIAPSVDADTVLTFEVEVSDPAGASTTDTVTVTVRDNGLAGFPLDTATLISSTGRPVGLAVNAGLGVSADLVSILPVSPDGIPDAAGKPDLLPYGVFELMVNVDPAGSSVLVTFYFPNPLPPGFVWYKYQGPPPGWVDFSAHVTYNADRTQATVTLTDGGAGDADGAANGVIVDPSGPAFIPTAQELAVDLRGGEDVSAYKIVAVPLTLANTDAVTFFNSQIGGYNTAQVRIFGWNAANQSFQEFPNLSALTPGASAWIISRADFQLTINGTSTAVSEGPLESLGFGVAIEEGWNLIGNPFGYEIEVARIVVAQGAEAAELTSADNHLTQPVFWVWRDGQYVQATALLPGEGGWLLKYTPGQGTAFFNAAQVEAAAAAREASSVREDLEQPPSPPQTLSGDQSGSSGGGAGGGCFVTSAGRPDRPWVAVLLLLLAVLAGAASVGRQRRS